jgi:hypothetical protein
MVATQMIFGIVIACTALFEVGVLRRLRFGWGIVALVLASTLLSVDLASYTPLYERNYDGPAHAEYIRSIADDLSLPSTLKCVACGHPPLYYALAALWSRGVHVGTWMPRDLGLQCFSLLLSFGFVVFALLTLRDFIPRPATLGLAAALIAFWPSSIINSIRVHNDALAALLMLAAMYFIARWDRQERPRDFYAALLASALALLTKATGYTAAATLLLFAALRMRSTHFSRESIRLGVVAVVALVASATLALSLRPAEEPLTPCQRVLGRACDPGRRAPVPFQARHFLGFDVQDFVHGTNSMVSESDEDYFLNRLLKSSLYGVFPLGQDFVSARHRVLAVVLNLTLLAMVVLVVVTLASVRPLSWSRYRALVVSSAIMLASLVAFRIRLPNPFHEDFRHIFPVLVPCCLVYAKVVERLGHRSRKLGAVGIALALVMIVSSVAFFVRI